jgi:hypothetical protein
MTSGASALEINPRSLDRRVAAPVPVAGPAAAPVPSPPLAPVITPAGLLAQFWKDIYGKEVQTTSTYSYTWVADQVGHVCLGILINFGLTLAAFYALPFIGIDRSWDTIAGLLIGSTAVSLWELSAYLSSAKEATGRFRLDGKLLRDNAAIAALYMILGVGVGFAFHQSALEGVAGFLALLAVAVICAPPWLREKIIWQKAALPYLFRLANAQQTIGVEAAQQLQDLIDKGAPPATRPCQVIIGGPIGSGRTAIAAGIGTEFAFKKSAVRYLSLAALLEFAARSSNSHFVDDTGPVNIEYWRWSEAQVVIIDDIGPLTAAQEKEQHANLEKFRGLLDNELAAVRCVLARCHTVWVVGDLCPDGEAATLGHSLDQFARAIAEFCGAQQHALVVELSEKPAPVEGARAKFGLDAVAQFRSVALEGIRNG